MAHTTQTLAPTGVAGGEDVADVGGVLAVFGLSVGAGVPLDAELGEDLVLGAGETHGQEDQVGGPLLLAPFHRTEGSAVGGLAPVRGRWSGAALMRPWPSSMNLMVLVSKRRGSSPKSALPSSWP